MAGKYGNQVPIWKKPRKLIKLRVAVTWWLQLQVAGFCHLIKQYTGYDVYTQM